MTLFKNHFKSIRWPGNFTWFYGNLQQKKGFCIQNSGHTRRKHLKNCEKLLREHLISCLGVKLFLLKICYFYYSHYCYSHYCNYYYCNNLSIWVLSQFDLLRTDNISSVVKVTSCLYLKRRHYCYCHYCHYSYCPNLSLRLVTIWIFELSLFFSLRFWVLSQFELFVFCQCLFFFKFLSFVTIYFYEFCHNLSFWDLSKFEFSSLVAIWVLSQFKFLILVTIWVFEFYHYLSSVTICFLSVVTIWVF